MRFEAVSRDKFSNLHLKPGIDPSDPTDSNLDSLTAQSIFIHQNPQQFFDALESRLLGKILDDIYFILQQGWAEYVSKFDLNHGHISGKSLTPIFKIDDLFSPDNVFVVYHTHEVWPRHPTKIILSSLKTQPVVVKSKVDKYSIDSSDLGLMSYADINFERKPNGPYKLRNGTELDVWGVLKKNVIYEYLQR